MASYCVRQDALSSCTTDCDKSGDVLSTRELTGDLAPRVLIGAGTRLPQPVSQYARRPGGKHGQHCWQKQSGPGTTLIRERFKFLDTCQGPAFQADLFIDSHLGNLDSIQSLLNYQWHF